MATDPDAPGWIAGALTLMGVGGGFPLLRMFAKQSNHDARILQLETDRKVFSRKIDDTHTTVTKLVVKSERIEGDISTVLQLLKDRE